MWIVAPFEKANPRDGDKLTFVDHEAIDLYETEAAARKAVKEKLRSGDPLVGLFSLEAVYDADVTVRPWRGRLSGNPNDPQQVP